MTDALRPHRRFNPLTGEWVLVSPQRAARPWLGAQESPAVVRRPAYDPTCYLCPGNDRAVGVTNEKYDGVWVFENDFPALLPPSLAPRNEGVGERGAGGESLFQRQEEGGVCRVICFSPRHDLTLPELPVEAVRSVVEVWAEQCEELGARPDISYVQVFENKGEAMGCSNPHPHGQIWATTNVPTLPALEQEKQRAYLTERGTPLLIDYAERELESGERVLFENDTWVALVPYWAVWPFETMLLPKDRVRRLPELTDAQRNGLALALKELTRRYDALFSVSFPYSMGVHQAPFDGEPHDEWQLHLHFYPPLLRSATVRKFLVGYEMLAQPQRDLTPEQAADRLRNL